MPDRARPGFSKVAFAYAANNFRRGVPETLDAPLEVVLASRVDGVRPGSHRWRGSYLLTHVKHSSISLPCVSTMADPEETASLTRGWERLADCH